jgi:flagellar motor protein MotB
MGLADTRPLQSNATALGRAANRRIEIIIKNN